MKRISIMSILLITAIIASGCNMSQSRMSESPIEMIAFSSLSDKEQGQIPVSPKDSVVRKVTVQGKEVYSVTFNHTGSDSNGNLIVYVDLDRKTIVGKGFSDN